MNFLSLAQRLRQETGGISGTGPVTVVSQTGEMKKVVDWVEFAYEDIQNLHLDWDFLRFDVSFPTIAATQTYTASSAGYPEYGEWVQDSFRSYLTATGVSVERPMLWKDWEDFRNLYMMGSIRATTGQPLYIAQKPDTSLIMWPIPNAVYTVVGEYFKRPQTMTVDADIPLIPAKFHMIIVWRALMLYAGQYAAPEMYAVGQKEYRRLLNEMEASQLPDMRMGETLV